MSAKSRPPPSSGCQPAGADQDSAARDSNQRQRRPSRQLAGANQLKPTSSVALWWPAALLVTVKTENDPLVLSRSRHTFFRTGETSHSFVKMDNLFQKKLRAGPFVSDDGLPLSPRPPARSPRGQIRAHQANAAGLPARASCPCNHMWSQMCATASIHWPQA